MRETHYFKSLRLGVLDELGLVLQLPQGAGAVAAAGDSVGAGGAHPGNVKKIYFFLSLDRFFAYSLSMYSFRHWEIFLSPCRKKLIEKINKYLQHFALISMMDKAIRGLALSKTCF